MSRILCLKAATLLIAALALAFLTSCSHIKIPDFKAHITLPASEDGFWVKTVGEETGRIPKEEWAKIRKRGIIILKDDWIILRTTLLENCLNNASCTDAVGAFDNLFYTIDQALGKLPGIQK